jgi:hypothetical protein
MPVRMGREGAIRNRVESSVVGAQGRHGPGCTRRVCTHELGPASTRPEITNLPVCWQVDAESDRSMSYRSGETQIV